MIKDVVLGPKFWKKAARQKRKRSVAAPAGIAKSGDEGGGGGDDGARWVNERPRRRITYV